MDDSFQRAPSVERISASIAGGVAALALVLAFVGIHGALAYSVARRHREIGVRVAIGATPWSVAIDVARLGIVVTCVGLAVGLPLAVMAAQSLRPLMYGISVTDAATFGIVGGLILLLGMTAGLLPARRAAAVDPVTALRGD